MIQVKIDSSNKNNARSALGLLQLRSEKETRDGVGMVLGNRFKDISRCHILRLGSKVFFLVVEN